ncbi:TIGR01244 family sulfur transferase [Marinomonas ostreistagni]|uniref:TIGR01244 family phosphatase n=1 Tax=Marinomonas ostreistagni TaxID=359209 RepID=A0ABS0ZDW0_9GAMM|nr:TIGR01244 family sulfur transferase [Marinomonas ostreistagni]MBJ7551830.1 TIGR01244 family phosphatase [Marinomonas ostreistagni]
MKITELSPQYSVSPQIVLPDVAELKRLGFDVVVNNRPDGESDDQPSSDQVKREVEEAGLRYVYNPINLNNLSVAEVSTQNELIQSSDKVFAYCRTGTRSSVLWVLALHNDNVSFDNLFTKVLEKGFDLNRCLPAMQPLKK